METSPTITLIPLGVAALAWNRKWLTPMGSFTGALLSSIIILSGIEEIFALLVFFLLGTFASKLSSRIVNQRQEKTKASKEKFTVINYEDDSVKGRNATQVLATAGIPALFCLLQLLKLPFDTSMITSFYYAFFACNLADTLASEFGVLSLDKPLLITTFQKVPRGTDGAISFEGCIASLIGGLIIGLTAQFSSKLDQNDFIPLLTPIRFGLIGFIGCMFDSLLGAIMQKPKNMAKNPSSWKPLNCLVNVYSGILTLVVDLLFQYYTYQSVLISLAFISFILLFISPISKFMARKLLHMGISIVVFTASNVFGLRSFISIVALVVSFLTLPHLNLDKLWQRFDKNEKKSLVASDSGIFLYSLVTGYVFYCFPTVLAEQILFPMYFSDSIGSIVGYYYGNKQVKKYKMEPIVSKSLIGSCAFFICQFIGLYFINPTNTLENLTLSANLALVELSTGSLDNLLLPFTFICLKGLQTNYLQLILFTLSGIISHFVLFNNRSSGYRQGLHAFYRFTRPHTIIGTSLSITIVMGLTLFDDLSFDKVEQILPVVSFGYFITVLSSLQANVFIVGLNQIYDVEIDVINKPYLPIASGEFTADFSNALVFFCLLTSTFNAYYYGNIELLYTVTLGNVMGTIYSVQLPFLHWKRFPILAASLIFMVRGGLVQIGFAEYSRSLVYQSTGLMLKPSLDNKYILFLAVFLTVFGVAIAMFKDVPDIAGDEEKGIRTFAVRFGARKVVNFVNFMLGAVYSAAAMYWLNEGNMIGCLGHVVTFVWLGLKLNDTIVKGAEAAKSIRASYMSIWKAFYLEYILVGGLFLCDKL